MSGLGNKEIFSKNLKRYIQLSGKTRIEICRDLNFSYSTFSEWVNGIKYPRIDKIEMLANYFGIKKSDLIEEAAQEQSLPNLTKKDELDISKQLEATLSALQNQQSGLMFDGEPLDEVTRELLETSLHNSMIAAKKIAKQRYTPKKYRKE